MDFHSSNIVIAAGDLSPDSFDDQTTTLRQQRKSSLKKSLHHRRH
jgi:hypothetical protein